MLVRLNIENYALIDRLEIGFNAGFSAITGETGAGKSILVDALDLVLGKRADSQILLDPERKCVVEATFSISRYNMTPVFEDAGLDYEELTIIRREISPNGKSRAFINDTPVTLNQLRFFGDLLVDVHAQHATTSLQDPGFQLSVVDSFAGHESKCLLYREKFDEVKQNRLQLDLLTASENKARAALDYKTFLFRELETAALVPDEEIQLEENLAILTHAEEIKSTLSQVQAILQDEEPAVLSMLSQTESNLKKLAAYHSGLGLMAERLKSSLIDLQDIYQELSRLNESIEYNHKQLTEIQQRLETLYRLQHKHSVNSVTELIRIKESLDNDLNEFTSLGQKIEEVSKHVARCESEMKELAADLTQSRLNAFQPLSEEIMASLIHMGMPEARFEIRRSELPDYTADGHDQIEFFFNANRGHSLKPLADVASGGELSRVMLAIKSIISKKKSLPTIIFDEIDNGLSGDVAGRVGDVLVKAAQRMQVIAVTHLPQIAGKAGHHYAVFKENKNNKTYSNIKYLDQQQRVAELAKLIGGRDITDASLAAAKELLNATLENH